MELNTLAVGDRGYKARGPFNHSSTLLPFGKKSVPHSSRLYRDEWDGPAQPFAVAPHSSLLRATRPFWQARYYDFIVHNEEKRIEKLRCMHRYSVVRDLVAKPKNWPWSSFWHHATGAEGAVEIESQWSAMRRGNPLPEYLRCRERAG